MFGEDSVAMASGLGGAHLDGAGLLWRISGGKIIAMYTDWAVIDINGEQHIVHRRPSPTSFVLPWRARVGPKRAPAISIAWQPFPNEASPCREE
jgi:hypothetical protein